MEDLKSNIQDHKKVRIQSRRFKVKIAQSTGAVEFTDRFSAEG